MSSEEAAVRTIRPFVFAASALAFLLVVGCGDDGDTAGSTTESTSSTTTTAPPSTDGSDPASPGVVWPPPGGDLRYSGPVDAASGFANEFVGFTDPIVGEFRRGDGRSGEVEVRSRDEGPITTVFVRQLDSEDWSVIGAATANIVLESPETLEEITSPVTLTGRATAFEGTVQTAVTDADGDRSGQGFVTGGSFGELGPFEGELDFDTPSGDGGAVVLYTVSARDGTVEEATAIAVRFPTDG